MELTQRFECTQELYSSDCEKINSEQIAFLGICGTKYPLKKGPNKIGRDPETCNIVLNLNSISRHHAVINILNSQDFMLMDLDSANKTKLSDRTLQPYIPQPIKNGDVVQFGQVFGVFRLLQEENDLPMTQPVDVVDTPVHNRHVSKLNVHATTIPESPEISDKDDSFIASSQQKSKNVFKSPNINFLKSSGKTISIKPIGTNKIDNAYWSSSKKSDSFSMQSNISSNLNDSVASSHTNEQKQNIHEMDTQIPYLNYSENEKIHELDTQIPNAMPNESIDSIYNANTQIVESVGSPNIYEMETQLPTPEKLPEVCKIEEQENLHINFTTDDKENDNNIHNAETQVVLCVKPTSPRVNVTNNPKLTSSSNISDDIILFDEVDNEPLPDNFESQQLLSPNLNIENDENNAESQDIHFVPRKRANIIESDSSTDCEDINIAFTQKIPEIKNDDDLTDCEEEPNILLKTNRKQRKSPDVEEDVTDCEDNLNDNDIVQPNENIENLLAKIVDEIKTDKEMTDVAKKDDSLEDLPTQIIEESKSTESNRKQRTVFHDLPTQVLNNEAAKSTFEEALTQQIYSEEVVKFKVPFKSPVKKKKKVDTNVKLNNNSAVIEIVDDDENYYASTQELLDDLCSQRDLSPEVQITNKDENQSSTEKASVTGLIRKDSPECLDAKRKIEEFVSNLTCSQIQDVIGVQKEVTVLKKMPSDGSDVVATPKKIDCLSILETDLPNTQEIKTGISLSLHSDAESLTDNHSESEIDSKTSTPIKIKHKQKATNKIRINLSNKFDPETIPVRSSSRVRKPTSRIQNCDETFKDTAEKILKPKSKAQEVKIGRRRSKENSEKHTKEKSDKSKTKVEDCDPSKTSNIIGTDQHYSKGNIEIDNTKKTKSKRGRKPKQKDETNVYELKIEATTSKELNESNSTDRRTLRKQKEEGKRRCESNSSSKTSKTPDEEKSRPDVTNKSNRKHTKERSTSPEIERDTTITKDKSRSAKLQVRKKSKERSKPEIEKQSNETTTERSRSSEKESKTKSTGERSKSRDEREVKKSTEESNKSIQKSEETDVRRSKRNRDKKSEEPIDVSRPNSSKHGLSTVYSTIDISSDSGTDTPNKLKRPATCEPEIPNAKKARSGGNTHKSILRATPARKDKTQYVLFTAFPCDEVKNKLVELGAVIVSDVTTCTVVLTLQIKRTFKLLCAVGLGKPIVGPNWVQACADTKMIVDPWLYLLKDEETERRFKFSLQQTLAGRREFLKGYNVSSTPNVVPKAAEMKLIVECSGGQWKEGGPKWVCVSNPADCALWAGLKRRGAVVVSTEFILGGVLTQTLDIEKTML